MTDLAIYEVETQYPGDDGWGRSMVGEKGLVVVEVVYFTIYAVLCAFDAWTQVFATIQMFLCHFYAYLILSLNPLQ